MKKTVKFVFILFVILLVVAGCLGKHLSIPRTDYYTLEYDPKKFDDLKPLSTVIRIDRFSVAPLYNTNKIIYKTKRFKQNAYNYHKWRANPGDMVTYFLLRDMKQSSLFKAIFEPGISFSPSHVISGTVDEFFEQDEKGSWKAILSVTITLIVENEPDISKRILFQKSYSANKKCGRKNPRALADAMSSAMTIISEMIITDVYKSLSKLK